LNELKQDGYNVLHVINVFGSELTKLIKESYIFININYNSSKYLDVCTLNEAVMSLDTHIVSEESDLTIVKNKYSERIYFTKKEDILKTVKKALKIGNKMVKKFDADIFNEEVKCNLGYLYKECIFVICNNFGGGSIKFIKDISDYYKVNITFIMSKNELLSSNLSNKSIILIQSFLFTDIEVDNIIDIYNKSNCKIILPIHDWYWFVFPYNNTYEHNIHYKYLSDMVVPEKTKLLFSICDKIICPSKFVFDIIISKFPYNNVYLQEWLDYDYKSYINIKPNIKSIYNNVINIGVLHEYHICKGKEMIDYLYHNFKKYKNYTINYFIIGLNIPKYNETEFFEYIEKYNIHSLLILNKWGETYCYSLSKSLMSGLPILYNNIGSFKDRIPHFDKYIINTSKEQNYKNNNILNNNFKKYIHYIIKNNGTYRKIDYNFSIKSNLLFDSIFLSSKKNVLGISKYAVYFPQFHEFKENNQNFYEGFTDIVNLCKLNYSKKDTPNLSLLDLKETKDYNIIKNDSLISKQFDLIDKYDIDGFAVYYYWFDINNITNKNTIMYDAINKLLN